MTGQARFGTQGWNYAAWVGTFYPSGTKPADFLPLYAQAFDTVEVDSTFYATPPVNSVLGWARRTPDDFVFALKLTREITHERRLRDSADELELFASRARLLGPKLGPVLVQMGPDFVPRELPQLERFLPLLPADIRFAVELRHHEWTRRGVMADVLSLLAEHRVALAFSDGRWMPRETVLELAARPTAGFHYLRWMGPNRDLTDFSHVQVDRGAEQWAWAQAMRDLLITGVDIFGYVNNHFAGHSPASARDFQRLLGGRPVDPHEIGEQTSLF